MARNFDIVYLDASDGLSPITVRKINSNFTSLIKSSTNTESIAVSIGPEVGDRLNGLVEKTDSIDNSVKEINRKLASLEELLQELRAAVDDAIPPIGSIMLMDEVDDPNDLYDNTEWERLNDGKVLMTGDEFGDGESIPLSPSSSTFLPTQKVVAWIRVA